MSLQLLQAQLHDRNWVFGKNNIVLFHNDSIEINYIDKNDTSYIDYKFYLKENIGCVSDSLGNLLLHNSDSIYAIDIDSLYYFISKTKVFHNKNEINNSVSNFIGSFSATNGTIILPVDNNNYLYLYLTNNEAFKDRLLLKYHWIELKNNEWQYKKYAQDLFIDFYLSERLKAVKHPNGKDWWVIAQEYADTVCGNKVVSMLLRQDSIIKINTYEGIKRCNPLSFIGEIAIAKNGDKVAMAYLNDSIEVFDFDRCTGLFGSSKLYRLNNQNLKAYGLEFSPSGELLYVNSKNKNDALYGRLQQIKLSDGLITDVSQYIFEPYQMELGPDGKLYFGYGGEFYRDSIFYPNARGFLHCIENPDSIGLACSVNLGKVKLNNEDWAYGLPNFPNYRLGALSIYEAGAGSDTVICTDSTINQKVVQLGSQKVNGVQYQWYPNYNLSSDTAAQPLAFPDSTTMYYVMLSDTSIKNACKTRLDSVYVEVRKCISSVHGQLSTVYSVKVFPNPASSEIKIQSEKHKIAHVAIHDIAGKIIALQLPLGRGL